MYDDILVPTDGSDAIDETLEHAIGIAAEGDATIHGLYVVDSRITAAAMDNTREDLAATLQAEGEAATAAIAEQAAEAGLAAETDIRKGTPWREILGYAESADIDVIVIGTHGKSAREKASLGSVSDRVLDGAEIPVLVVRNA
ncbi:MAG: universal stress protein [Natrialbaceae archaeon]|nr:universal stress protein [Natrialbaceae archaeon]